MRKKEYSAYMPPLPMKYSTVEEAVSYMENLRQFCYRYKQKQEEEIHFILGVSTIGSSFVQLGSCGKIGYDKPKNQGGKKQYIPRDIKRIDRKTGEVKIVRLGAEIQPHIHLFVYGYGASTCANKIVEKVRKKYPNYEYPHPTHFHDVGVGIEYVKEQSTHLREV